MCFLIQRNAAFRDWNLKKATSPTLNEKNTIVNLTTGDYDLKM